MTTLEVKNTESSPEAPSTLSALDNAQFPLQGLRLIFDTADDDKDADTVVGVSIDNGSILMGSGNVGSGDHWDDGSHREVSIPVANGVDYYSAGSGSLTITIFPNGNDEWHFNVGLEMLFAGNGRRTASWGGLNLAEDRRTATLRWS